MYKDLINEFTMTINDSSDEKKLYEIKNIFIKNKLTPLYSKLKEIPNEQKKDFGQKLNELKNEINNIFEEKIKNINLELSNNICSDFNPLINVSVSKVGGVNPINQVINDINLFFRKYNFEIIDGDEVIETKYNFDNLNINEGHPARNYKDTFYINKNKLLRTHCTSVSSKKIENSKSKEIKMISYGNVYRKDDDDATHSHQFNQVDIIWVKKGLNLSNLKWIVEEFLKFIFKKEILKTRYRLSYFPFTEPSFEVDMSCIKCEGKGCNICKQTGWIEILGAGIFHKEVIKKANLDREMVGLAAGVGIDRIAMLKYGINDIRLIYNNDFRVLNWFKRIR